MNVGQKPCYTASSKRHVIPTFYCPYYLYGN